MSVTTLGFFLFSLLTQIPFSAKTPTEAVQRVVQQVTGSRDSVPNIHQDSFIDLPRPGAGIEFIAWASDKHTDISTVRVEIVARRYGRMLVRRSFIFPRVSTQMVVVTKRSIAKGQLIKPSDLKLESPKFRSTNDPVAVRLDQVSGRVATQTLRPNRPIPLRHLREEYRVNRGDLIQVRIRAHGLKLTMTGEAMENGSMGETVRVANPKSGRVVRARVVDVGVGEVEAL